MVLCEACEAFDIQTLAQGCPRGYSYETTVQSAKQGCDFCRALAEHSEVRERARGWRLVGEDVGFHFELFDGRALHRHHQPEPDASEGDDEGGIKADHLRITLAPRYFVQLSQFASNEYLTIDFYLAADPGMSRPCLWGWC